MIFHQQTGSFESRCRMECMSLMNIICPSLPGSRPRVLFCLDLYINSFIVAIPGIASAGEWIHNKVKSQSVGAVVSIFEATKKKIRLPVPATFSKDKLLYWYTQLYTSLDCYIWLFAEGHLQPRDIFKAGIAPTRRQRVNLSLILMFVSVLQQAPLRSQAPLSLSFSLH